MAEMPHSDPEFRPYMSLQSQFKLRLNLTDPSSDWLGSIACRSPVEGGRVTDGVLLRHLIRDGRTNGVWRAWPRDCLLNHPFLRECLATHATVEADLYVQVTYRNRVFEKKSRDIMCGLSAQCVM